MMAAHEDALGALHNAVAQAFAAQLRRHNNPNDEYQMGPQDFGQIIKFLKDNDIKVERAATTANPAVTSLINEFSEMGIAIN